MADAPDAGALPSLGVLGGTGPQGRGLGLRLAVAGHRVVLGSRDPARAADAAGRLRTDHGVAGDRLTGSGNADAATCDVVVVTLPFDGVEPTLAALADTLDGAVVISCVNRLGFDERGPYPIPVPQGSAAELVAALAPGAAVVGAFHHVPARRLSRDTGPIAQDVLVTGDDDEACRTVCAMAGRIPGMRGVRAGPLRLTRPVEELTAALVAVNTRYRVAAGVRVTGLDAVAGD